MGCSGSTASQPMVRESPPKCTLLSPASGRMEGTNMASVPDAYKVDGFVACSKFLKGFQLKKGDQVIVHPDMATLEQSCDKTNCGWSEDKEEYIVSLKPEDVGTVGKCDLLGEGRRVQWCDGHWWSFPMEVLAVRLASLHASQRQFLQDGSDEWVVWSSKVKAASQVVEIKSTLGAQWKKNHDTASSPTPSSLFDIQPRIDSHAVGPPHNQWCFWPTCAGAVPAPQSQLPCSQKGQPPAEAPCAAEQGASESIVEEIMDTAEVVLQEALAEGDADASEGSDDEEPDDDEQYEEEDDEEDEEEEDEDDDDESDGLPGGSRKAKRALKKAKKAASLAYGLYTLVAA